MKHLILTISSIVLISCNNNEVETIVQGNVFNIAENENWPNPKIDLYKTSGGVETTTSNVIKTVIGDSSGDFEFTFSSTNNHPYKAYFNNSLDEVIMSSANYDGLNSSSFITVGQTNTIQMNIATYSHVQIKIIKDLNYDSMYWEVHHLLIESFKGSANYFTDSHDYSIAKVPSGLRTFKTIKYLNGVETITIDTMDFEPMQTYNLEFHY